MLSETTLLLCAVSSIKWRCCGMAFSIYNIGEYSTQSTTCTGRTYRHHSLHLHCELSEILGSHSGEYDDC